MIWESSRGGRRDGAGVNSPERCERRSASIVVTTHDRCYGPDTGGDRRSLLEDAVDSEHESSTISVRRGAQRRRLGRFKISCGRLISTGVLPGWLARATVRELCECRRGGRYLERSWRRRGGRQSLNGVEESGGPCRGVVSSFVHLVKRQDKNIECWRIVPLGA